MAYITFDETGRLNAYSEDFHVDPETEVEIDPPEEFDEVYLTDWVYRDRQLVYDKKPEPVDRQIFELKRKLAQTDYVVIKMAESSLVSRAMPLSDTERYSEIIAQRQEWRDKINELEAQYNQEGVTT